MTRWSYIDPGGALGFVGPQLAGSARRTPVHNERDCYRYGFEVEEVRYTPKLASHSLGLHRPEEGDMVLTGLPDEDCRLGNAPLVLSATVGTGPSRLDGGAAALARHKLLPDQIMHGAFSLDRLVEPR